MRSAPIIRSLLDTDFYQFTMAQFAWKYFRDLPVRYEFINRTPSIDLVGSLSIEQLREELAHVRSLRFQEDELAYLANSPAIQKMKPELFAPEFLDALRALRLPELEVEPVQLSDGTSTFQIVAEGSWLDAIWWETFVLSTVNELRCRSEMKRQGLSEFRVLKEARRRLQEKIILLRRHPDVRFVEFGTRRRFSRNWQHELLASLLAQHPEQLLGTSNVSQARYFSLNPFGTMAHQTFQVLYGHSRSLKHKKPAHEAQSTVLTLWRELYGSALSTALTDTWTLDFFLRTLTDEQIVNWQAYRLDSGDPIEGGEKIIAMLQRAAKRGLRVNPEDKMIFPSDGLTVPDMIHLTDHFKERIGIAHGPGTNFTFDVGFITPISIVMKIVTSCGFPSPKLSDNPAKAIGDKAEIERIKREIGYVDRPAQPIMY